MNSKRNSFGIPRKNTFRIHEGINFEFQRKGIPNEFKFRNFLNKFSILLGFLEGILLEFLEGILFEFKDSFWISNFRFGRFCKHEEVDVLEQTWKDCIITAKSYDWCVQLQKTSISAGSFPVRIGLNLILISFQQWLIIHNLLIFGNALVLAWLFVYLS